MSNRQNEVEIEIEIDSILAEEIKMYAKIQGLTPAEYISRVVCQYVKGFAFQSDTKSEKILD